MEVHNNNIKYEINYLHVYFIAQGLTISPLVECGPCILHDKSRVVMIPDEIKNAHNSHNAARCWVISLKSYLLSSSKSWCFFRACSTAFSICSGVTIIPTPAASSSFLVSIVVGLERIYSRAAKKSIFSVTCKVYNFIVGNITIDSQGWVQFSSVNVLSYQTNVLRNLSFNFGSQVVNESSITAVSVGRLEI